MDTLTDEELMAVLAAGCEDALAPLHARYAGLVFGTIAHHLDRSAAEEITQDVFLTAWQKAHTYDPDRGQVRTWLLQIARSRVLNELRRRGRRPRLLSDPDETRLDAVADEAPSPDEAAWTDYRRDAVSAAVAALPAAQRQALSLAYFDDLTQQQIADSLGVPLGTAKTRIRAGMQRLRAELLPLVAVVLLTLGGARFYEQQLVLQRQERALGIVTASDATTVHLTLAPSVPAEAHSTYHTRHGADLALMSFAAFPPAPPGSVHQAWARRDGVWQSLGVVSLDAAGHGHLIVDQPGAQPPEALQITLEPAGGSAAPHGPVIAAAPLPSSASTPRLAGASAR